VRFFPFHFSIRAFQSSELLWFGVVWRRGVLEKKYNVQTSKTALKGEKGTIGVFLYLERTLNVCFYHDLQIIHHNYLKSRQIMATFVVINVLTGMIGRSNIFQSWNAKDISALITLDITKSLFVKNSQVQSSLSRC
jgi:hypothetical protein